MFSPISRENSTESLPMWWKQQRMKRRIRRKCVWHKYPQTTSVSYYIPPGMLFADKELMDKTRPWEQTGETQEIYNARHWCGSMHKGMWGGVPSVEQYKAMKAGENIMFTAYDTRGD